jgi:hypothetical protein
MLGVVHELQVDVRIVHSRVAPQGVAADVQGVSGPLRDLQARFPGRVEDRRRDL